MRDFSKRAKALDSRINKLQALQDGKVSPERVRDMKTKLRVRSKADVKRELLRLKEVGRSAREKSNTFSRKAHTKRTNAEAERFSRYKPVKAGAGMKYGDLANPEEHYKAWNDRWAKQVKHVESDLDSLE